MATAVKTKGKHKNGKKKQHRWSPTTGRSTDEARPPMTAKEFERELEPLQEELVKLQEWVKATGAKICIVFEGRDAAGKGGTIKRIAERVSPRVFRVIALPAPTEREKSQMYIQRYLPHLPAAGEVVIFDRSWYNRAGVERVMGYATESQVARVSSPRRGRRARDDRLRHHPDQVLARSRPGGADPALARSHQRRSQDVEVEPDGPGVVQPLVRLLPGTRCDVRCLRRAGITLARRGFQREAPGAAELHCPPLEPDSVRRAYRSRRSNCPSARHPTATTNRNTPTASIPQRY